MTTTVSSRAVNGRGCKISVSRLHSGKFLCSIQAYVKYVDTESVFVNSGENLLLRGPGSSVGIATDYGLDGPGSNPGGDEIFRPSRPALGSTQPPVKWVPDLSRGVKCGRGVLQTTHPLLVPRSWKSIVIPLPTLWATPGL